jgi:nucleoside-diphosphate-sugar epimerase
MSGHMFIFGAGFSGQALAQYLLKKGWRVTGTTRSAEKAHALRERGLDAVVFDGAPDPGVAAALAEATHLVISIAPAHGMGDKQSGAASLDPVLEAFGASLRSATHKLEWIGYWSTVGVYGDHEGDWVDEDAECRPASRRAKMRVDAETAWTELGQEIGLPVAVMRLAGIYGPGRNAFVKLAEGTAKRIVKPGQVFSRIHVDDIAGTTALLAQKRIGSIFNICDDEPAPPQDVISHAAGLMGIEPPPDIPFDEAEMTPMARSFYGDNKRVSNARIRDLGYTFAYPDYRSALERMWREESWN